jgi:hypothetical protein
VVLCHEIPPNVNYINPWTLEVDVRRRVADGIIRQQKLAARLAEECIRGAHGSVPKAGVDARDAAAR